MKKKLPKGIMLDVGCQGRKQDNFIGMDWKDYPGVDFVHNLEKFPYPFSAESCLTIKCAHVIEHIKPWLVIPFMNELWRLLIPNGQLAISAPYAGSPGHYQDPTHCTMISEGTWRHFDPSYPDLYDKYAPRPWKIEHSAYKPDGNIEAVMRKVIPIDLSNSLGLANKALELGAMQKPVELMFFLEHLKDKKLKTVVEIGTANGGVLYALCQMAADDAHLISIDLPGGEFGGGYPVEALKRFKKFRKGHQVLDFLMEDSHSPKTKNKLTELLGNNSIDLLFIDGDHTYKGVKQDWQMYSPLVKKGGTIAFHDICTHLNVPRCEVDKFWKQVKKGKQSIEYIDTNDTSWGGIGVITK